jgi:hypothetical protein
MKKLVLFISLSLFLAGCQKDEVDVANTTQSSTLYTNTKDTVNEDKEVSPRNGTADLVLYRGSLSTDNYLRVSATSRVYRTHTAYNKDKVAYLSFRPGTLGRANIGGVLNKHYQIEIKYKDSTTTTFTAFSKDTLDRFKFIPKGNNLFHSSHPSKKLEWIHSGKTLSTIHELRSLSYSNLNTWNIYADGRFIIQKVKDPADKSQVQFSIPHSH